VFTHRVFLIVDSIRPSLVFSRQAWERPAEAAIRPEFAAGQHSGALCGRDLRMR